MSSSAGSGGFEEGTEAGKQKSSTEQRTGFPSPEKSVRCVSSPSRRSERLARRFGLEPCAVASGGFLREHGAELGEWPGTVVECLDDLVAFGGVERERPRCKRATPVYLRCFL
jgi:hypothetical protein